MSDNINGKFSRAKERSTWKQFDRFPRKVREILANAPFNVSTKCVARILRQGHSPETLAKAIQFEMQRSARLTYGPDHPQAGGGK